MSMVIKFDDLISLTARALTLQGMSARNAQIVAYSIVASDRDGSPTRGVLRLPDYISSLQSGWVDGNAVPQVERAASAVLRVDACNGFAQVALDAARDQIVALANQNGVGVLSIYNSHHYTSLYPDIEPLAERGLIALAFVNSRSYIVPSGGATKLFGTNPMAFACPREGAAPLIWDQSSSVMSRGDVQFAARMGRSLPAGVGLDASGQPTVDPHAVLAGGAFLPFGGHKGSLIAMMVELMAAAATGGRFGFEDEASKFPGATTSHAGELIIAIDPARTAGRDFSERVEALLQRIVKNGHARLPGDRRNAARFMAMRDGIVLDDDVYKLLHQLAQPANGTGA